MCKQLGAFRRLDQRDQVTLLRTSLVELLILRGAMAFDASNEEWRAAIMSAAAGADSRPHPFCLNLSVLPETERHSKEHKRSVDFHGWMGCIGGMFGNCYPKKLFLQLPYDI